MSTRVQVYCGAAAFLGFALYYGLDPRKTKAGNISIGVTVEEVLEALEAANIKIEAIDSARRHTIPISVCANALPKKRGKCWPASKKIQPV